MKKVIALLLSLILIFSTGCAPVNTESKKNVETSVLQTKWEDNILKAKGQTVNFYMWGGSSSVNAYVDNYVKPLLKKTYGVELNRVPVTDIKDIINKLAAEKEAGKKDGSVDLMWINGENFKACKSKNLLYGNIASVIPNYNKYADVKSADMNADFGTSTDGLEVPWGKAKFVLVYDSARVKADEVPKTLTDLLAWTKSHPGRFTYPAPPDFTGSAFLRHVLYEANGGYEMFSGDLSKENLTAANQKAYDLLKSHKKDLWHEGKTYPESSAKLDQLFASGEVDFTMSYNPVHAMNMLQSGNFPDSVRTLIFENGTIANTHYLAVPYNAKNVEGALALIDVLLSPEAQAEKNKPETWGDFTVLNVGAMDSDKKKLFDAVKLDQHVPTLEEISKNALPELKPELLVELEKGWSENVAK